MKQAEETSRIGYNGRTRETAQANVRLKGRKPLVTGGDSGIGRAAVIAVAREAVQIIREAGTVSKTAW